MKIRLTMNRQFITITVMQMLHTHEATQAGEGGSDEQLVCGQFEYKTRLSNRGCTHRVKHKERKNVTETAAQTHTID